MKFFEEEIRIKNLCNFHFKGGLKPEAKKRHEETHRQVEIFTKWMCINIVFGSVGLFASEAFSIPLFDYFPGKYSMDSRHLAYQVK